MQMADALVSNLWLGYFNARFYSLECWASSNKSVKLYFYYYDNL